MDLKTIEIFLEVLSNEDPNKVVTMNELNLFFSKAKQRIFEKNAEEHIRRAAPPKKEKGKGPEKTKGPDAT